MISKQLFLAICTRSLFLDNFVIDINVPCTAQFSEKNNFNKIRVAKILHGIRELGVKSVNVWTPR